MIEKFDNRPIGVFDSGIGGLTVLRELLLRFPNENFIYLGDTARLPYGTKSPETVRKFSEQNMKFLISKDVKAVVVACNTASTQIFETQFQNRPVYNVIDPGSLLAKNHTQNKVVGVLGTRATVKANSYEKKIKALDLAISVISVACPLFVPLAEEGWHEDVVTEQIAIRYLSELKKVNPDTVILGCTHYPLLKSVIQKVMGDHVMLIDSGEAIGSLLNQDFLNHVVLPNDKTHKLPLEINITDFASQFEDLTRKLLNSALEKTHRTIQFNTVTVI